MRGNEKQNQAAHCGEHEEHGAHWTGCGFRVCVHVTRFETGIPRDMAPGDQLSGAASAKRSSTLLTLVDCLNQLIN
jgi:hypothetical protein